MSEDTCSVGGCDKARKYVAAGLCGMHYVRLRRHGDVGASEPMRGVLTPANGLCVIEGCERTVDSFGWCSLHHDRWRSTGDPTLARHVRGDDDTERFWRRVNKQTDGCWHWTGTRDQDGYGVLRAHKQRNIRAHRFAYELIVGPVGDGLVMDHLCRVRHCVNPEHLEPVTPRENVVRGEPKQRPHCANGHERTPENVRIRPDGARACRVCERERQRIKRRT